MERHVRRLGLWIGILFLFGSTFSACALRGQKGVSEVAWFGLVLPTETWHVQLSPYAENCVSTIVHQQLDDCQVTLMTRAPSYPTYYPPDWGWSSDTEVLSQLEIQRLMIRDDADELRLLAYDVYDRTGSRGFSLYRLAYFSVESEDQLEACGTAFHELLVTLDPACFPDLPIAQG